MAKQDVILLVNRFRELVLEHYDEADIARWIRDTAADKGELVDILIENLSMEEIRKWVEELDNREEDFP
jgi:hypothetical protein